ncbi:MAG: hypothetical protein AAFO61_13575 [Pseudomonadota bacterium]
MGGAHRPDWKALSAAEKVEALAAMPRGMTAVDAASKFENCSRNSVISTWNRNRHIFPRRNVGRKEMLSPAPKQVRAAKPKPAGWRGMTTEQKIVALVALPAYFTAEQCAQAIGGVKAQAIRQFWSRNREAFPADRQSPSMGRPDQERREKPTEFVEQTTAPSGFKARPTPIAPHAPSGGVAYLDARDCHCAFPLWGNDVTRLQDKRVCGAPVEPGKKGSGARYCKVHAEFAISPGGKLRRKTGGRGNG